jgi:hypothetical protein
MKTPRTLIYATLLFAASHSFAFAQAKKSDKTDKAGEEARAAGAVVKSKSNITNNREAGQADSSDSSSAKAAGAVVKSKSNITNNREAQTDSSSGNGQSKQK